MKIKVERVNPSGKSFLSGGEIYMKGKTLGISSFNGLEGQTVDIELEGKFVTKLTKSGNAPQAEAVVATVTKEAEAAVAARSTKKDYRSLEQLNRVDAVKAVLGSPAIALILQSSDLATANDTLASYVAKVEAYITSGHTIANQVSTESK